MSSVSIRAALEVSLNSISSGFDTAFENIPFTPTTGTPYQRAFLLLADPDNPSIGAGLHREQGIFQVNLAYPVNAGSQAAMTRAEAIREQFSRGTSMSSGGVTVIVDNTPSIAVIEPEADRFRVAVRIPFHANVFS